MVVDTWSTLDDWRMGSVGVHDTLVDDVLDVGGELFSGALTKRDGK